MGHYTLLLSTLSLSLACESFLRNVDVVTSRYTLYVYFLHPTFSLSLSLSLSSPSHIAAFLPRSRLSSPSLSTCEYTYVMLMMLKHCTCMFPHPSFSLALSFPFRDLSPSSLSLPSLFPPSPLPLPSLSPPSFLTLPSLSPPSPLPLPSLSPPSPVPLPLRVLVSHSYVMLMLLHGARTSSTPLSPSPSPLFFFFPPAFSLPL